MSKGTRAEHDAVHAVADETVDGWTETWAWWRDRFVEAGLEALWQDAGKPDARFPRWPGDDSLTSAERALARMVEIDQERHKRLLEDRDLMLAQRAETSIRISALGRALEHIAHMPHGETENEAITYAQNALDGLRKKP